MKVDQDEFKKNCSYLFDISEPTNDVFSERQDKWEISWYLKFESSFQLYDFELNWRFIKNSLINEKNPGVIKLPKLVGFETTKQSTDDELIYHFK